MHCREEGRGSVKLPGVFKTWAAVGLLCLGLSLFLYFFISFLFIQWRADRFDVNAVFESRGLIEWIFFGVGRLAPYVESRELIIR